VVPAPEGRERSPVDGLSRTAQCHNPQGRRKNTGARAREAGKKDDGHTKACRVLTMADPGLRQWDDQLLGCTSLDASC